MKYYKFLRNFSKSRILLAPMKGGVSVILILFPSLVFGANETIIPPSDGSPLIGLNTQAGDNKEIYANGAVTVTNAIDASANTGAKDQQSIVTLEGGSINLGVGSTIQSTDGWTAKKSELNGVGSWASGASFKAQDLTIDLATSANSQASAVSGIGPLGTGVAGVEDKSNVSTMLTGTTNINIKSDSNSWIAGGVYWGGAGGNILNADILNINVSSSTIGDTPSDRNGVFGLESVGNNSVSYNQVNVNISDDVKNDSLVGVWGGVGGLNSGFSIKGGDTNITLNGGNSGQRLIGFGGIGVTVEGDTNVTLNSGGNGASLIGINAVGQFNIRNETNKSNELNVIIDSKGYANNAMYGIYQSASTGTFYASTDAVRVINKDNVLNGSHLIYSKGDLQINTKELVVRDESANSFKDAIKAEDGAKISLSSTQSSIKGDMITAGTGRIDHQSGQGEWTGYANDNSTGTINLQLGNKTLGTSYVWNMTDSSVVSSSRLNNTTVNFTNQGFTTLKTDNLSGSNNVFNMKTDLVAHQGDLIDTFLVSGEHKLNITNQGSSNTNGTETLTIVKTNYDFSQADFSLTHQVEAGAYQYGLRESPTDSSQLELYSTGKKTSTATSAASFLNIGYLTNYIENQTLLQRLGDVRNNEAVALKSDGFWMKGFGGKLSAFSGSGLDGFDMTYTGTQMGIDKHIDVANGSLLVGAMAGFTRTNPNYKQGDGNGKNYTAGLYATYFLDNGIYVDSVLKYNSMINHFNVEDTAGTTVKGTSKTHGISLSTEVGKRFWLVDGHQGIYLEPQAQLSYGYQSGDSVHSSNGLKVGLSHYNSTLGRASVIAGYQIRGQNPINVYVKTGVVREMSGGSSYRFNNGEKNGHAFRSSWFDNGVGANVTINKQHNIYVEADYSTGGKFDNAMMNIGYRYSF